MINILHFTVTLIYSKLKIDRFVYMNNQSQRIIIHHSYIKNPISDRL